MSVQIRVLGVFSVRRDHEEVPPGAFGGRLPRQLVRVLVTRRGSLVPTDVIVEALWPRRAPADPRANVKVLVNRARRALGDPSLIVTGTGGYAFAETTACTVDAELFRTTVARAQRHQAGARTGMALHELRRAIAMWGGEPLPEDTYAAWAHSFRQALTDTYVGALESAAAASLQLNDPAGALNFAHDAVSLDPVREPANLLLVRARAAAGDHAGAVMAFHAYRRRLADDLGLDPSPDAIELERRLLRTEPLERPVEAPSPVPRGTAVAGLELPFVGRAPQVRAIERALAADTRGLAVVAGRSGTGKSRLLAEITRRSDIPVLSVRGFPAARTVPWSLSRALLTAALELDAAALDAVPPRAVHALADLIPEITEAPIQEGGSAVAESRRALVVEGALRLIARATAPAALIVVDDLQWVDASSLELLALAHVRVDRLGLLLAYRPEEIGSGGPVQQFLDDVRQGRPGTRQVELGPLPASELRTLVADDELVTLLQERTDRTPLAVTELLRRLRRQDVIRRDAGFRWHLRDGQAIDLAQRTAEQGQEEMILDRVAALPQPRRELLLTLALAGRETSAGILGRALDVEAQALLEDLHALSGADLVRLGDQGWTTAHDFVAETLAEHLEPAHRGRLHALLATALAGHGNDPAQIAEHLAGAGDTEAAAASALTAAGERLDRFANLEARELAGRGLALTSRPRTAAALLGIRAEAHARLGELTFARDDLRVALVSEPRGPQRSHVLSRVAALSLGAEDFDRGSQQAELALVEAGDDPPARAAALFVCAIADMNVGRTERSERRYAEALAIFAQRGDARSVAEVAAARAMSAFMDGDLPRSASEFRHAAGLLEDTGDLLASVTPRTTGGHALVFMARPEEALQEVAVALELSDALGHPEGRAVALAHRSEALTGLGRIDEARDAATESVRIIETIGHRAWTALTFRALGIVHLAAADLPAAEEAFRRALDASTVPQLVGWACASLARVLVARGELTDAAAQVRRALTEGTPLARHAARLAQAELAVAAGDPGAPRIAAQALAQARAAGHLVSVRRLAELAGVGKA